MATLKLPIVVVIAIVAALAGGAASYVFIPNTDPETKALLERQVELAEQEAAAREEAAEPAKDFFNANPDDYPTAGGQQMAPRWGDN
jgi:Ti type entry exclusion protein TrbK